MHKAYTVIPFGKPAPSLVEASVALIGYMVGFFVITVLSCGDSPYKNDSAETSGFTAVVYEPDGKNGAEGAAVKLFDFGSAGTVPAGVYITDHYGRFAIGDMPSGIYSLWVETDSFVLFQDSVVVSASHTNLRDDTLEYPSSISGIVAVQPHHDPRRVTIRIVGIGRHSDITDENGTFTLAGLAGGTYSLLLESPLSGYLPTICTISVAAIPHDTLADTLSLIYTGIPVVTGLRILQDTLNGTITVSWDKTGYGYIQDYLLYKDTGSGNALSPVPFAATTDTFFIDSSDCRFTADTTRRNLGYRIVVRDKMKNTGPAWQHIVIAVAPAVSASTVFFPHVRYGQKECDSASIGDTIMVALAARNPTRALSSLVWYDSAGDTIAARYLIDTMANGLDDTLMCVFEIPGAHRLLAVVTDDGGMKWNDTVSLRIVTDAPRVSAGRDTGVFRGDTVWLHGSTTQCFGRIVDWKWKIGSGEWTSTAGPDTFTLAPSEDAIKVCSLAVTDDDGNRGTDEILIYGFSRMQRIAASGDHSFFLTTDGSLWACGSNTYGQLGDGTTTNRFLPVNVMNNVAEMSAGSFYTLVLKTDGTLWACGRNDFGELGDGTTVHHPTPVWIMADVKNVAAGYNLTLIVKTDNSLWVCGHNCIGPQGDSLLHDYLSPTQVMSDVEYVAAGKFHSLVLKTDGTLLAWGRNDYGELGDGTSEERFLPVEVMRGVLGMAAGESHSLILKTDGSLWACGANRYGQLGDGSTEDRSLPVRVMDGIRSIAAGSGHSLLVKADGTLWACGSNISGQLGDTTTENRGAPVMVMSGIKQAAAGFGHSLMLRTDGSVWACGSNIYGLLGDGTRENRLTPQMVHPRINYESK